MSDPTAPNSFEPLPQAKSSSQAPMPPTTTHQEDLVVSGQRQINLIWELSQAIIAVTVVMANVIAAMILVIGNRQGELPLVLTSSLFLIIGFYFSRTNHQAIGGIGRKANMDDSQVYKGR